MSKPFTFDTVAAITVERGAARRLGEMLAPVLPSRDLLVVTDAGLHRAGVLDAAKAALTSAGFTLTIFDEVMPDPSEAVLLACVAQGRGAGAVLGLGGGSSLDIAKMAAVLLANDQPLDQMYGIGKITGSRLPLVQMPTTSGTGSEVTNISILTRPDQSKMGIVGPQLFADRVILDAELTVGLPRVHTAASGIDAMVHAIEAYTSQHRKNPLSDALAREALRLLAANLVTACEDPTNLDAREAMLYGAMLAGQAFTNAPVAAVHALAYPLGGRYHVPHGLSNALMLAPVLRFNAASAAPLYAELADVLLPGLIGDNAEKTEAFITHMIALMDASGAPRRLRDAGVTQDSLPTLAADAMLQQRLLVNNPVPVTEADALTLYRQAF